MKICPNCKATLDDSAVFCTTCGARLDANEQPNAQPAVVAAPAPNYGAPQQPYAPAPAYDPYDHTAEYDPKDISDNKVFAMVCYILSFVGIIIALLASKDSEYTKFHVRQSLKLAVTEILVMIVGAIIPFLGWFVVLPIGLIILFVLQIICFFQVCRGKAKEPAIIRSFGFLK